MKTLTAACMFVFVLLASVAASAEDKAAASAPPPATAAPAASSAVAPATAPAPKPLDNPRASYLIGLSLGEQLKHTGIGAAAIKPEELAKGVRDALSGTAQFKPADGEQLNAWVIAARGALGERNHAAARDFLAKKGKEAGVVTTSSGLEYTVLAAGAGDPPKPTDEVSVQYRGTLLDGTEFDSSYKHGKPASFRVNGVIKGWQEALLLMKPGAKFKLYVPPELAYDLNSPPGIPPGSLLVFEVELLSVHSAP